MTRFWRLVSIGLFAAILFAGVLPLVASAAPAAAPSAPQASADDGYKLGSGDKLRVIVFGENDLGGEYVLDGAGFISLPLIGQIHAAGDTIHQFEAEVSAKLKDGYLKDPRVSVEVINYRPFYIIGEIMKPGEYAYVNGMSVLNAVALAGGYTFRANERQVYVRRGGAGNEQPVNADQTTKIYPGDIIRVAERFF
jgi:polysaccharide export outer membrane protein